jgi:hypothetical protein
MKVAPGTIAMLTVLFRTKSSSLIPPLPTPSDLVAVPPQWTQLCSHFHLPCSSVSSLFPPSSVPTVPHPNTVQVLSTHIQITNSVCLFGT